MSSFERHARKPAYERSVSSLVNFNECDNTLSELLFGENSDVNIAAATSMHNEEEEENHFPGPSQRKKNDDSTQPTTTTTAAATAARVTTLERRNLRLQAALAAATVQHAREVSTLRREVESLRHSKE